MEYKYIRRGGFNLNFCGAVRCGGGRDGDGDGGIDVGMLVLVLVLVYPILLLTPYSGMWL